MPSAKHHAYEPGSEAAARLNALVASFADAWHHGRKPDIDAFLPADGDDLFRRAALVELVHADLELRAAAGEAFSAETYFRRYPDLEQNPDLAVDLLVAVKDLRQRQLGAPARSDSHPVRVASGPPPAEPPPEAEPTTLPPSRAPAAVVERTVLPAGEAGARAVLEVIEGPHRGTRLEFDRHATCVVGRSRRAPLPLPNDRHFSRHHLLLEFQPPLAFLRDLDSRNGTLVNGVKVKQTHLNDGDVIGGGKTRIRFSVPTGFESPTGTVRAHVPPSIQAVARSIHKSALSTATYRPAPPAGAGGLPSLPGYLVVRSLGRGALGEVFEACRLGGGARVALKWIPVDVTAGADAVQAFLQEARRLGELDHPRLVRLLEAGTAGDHVFCITAFVETIDVRRLLASQPSAALVRTACGVVCQALEALKYTHARGLVHREIKPGNLLVTRTDRKLHTYLADFGLARHYENAGLGGLMRTGDLRGALPYLAPEQVLDCHNTDPAADLYGVGATLYYLLTGKTPHVFAEGRDPYAIVLEDPIVPLGRHGPWLPPGLMDVVHRALAKRPGERFGSAAEMRHALLPFARG
jgi:pSer/pThr/pTyr-binding forkhead associated (FHA) protein